jgi:lipid II:glycine glycyltransferase (peptidoglycan interpeptide bridge formation enzyme)
MFAKFTEETKQIAKENRLDFVRIEPTDPSISREMLRENGFRESARFIQPPTTVISDLSGSEDDIKSRLSQTARRYAKKGEKAGLTFSVSYKPSDIREFLTMIHEVSARTGAKFHDDLYFQTLATSLFPTKNAGLLFAELDDKKVASIIFYTDGETMSYAHAANLTEYRKISPTYFLGLNALFFAKKQGCEKFDWFGCAPENYTDKRYESWAGLTQFKMSFGGKRISRIGTWELPVRKWRYFLYRTLLKFTGRG